MDITTKKVAVQITHTLSKPSKMPCKGYSLPAVTACNVGGKLANVHGSVCSGCYADRGCYQWNSTKNALAKRLEAIRHPKWVEAMVVMIGNDEYFRWHDSGDIQDIEHFLNIIDVCEKTPNTRHWLPSKEHGLIKAAIRNGVTIPDNLTIRISGAMVDGKPPIVTAGLNTSTVHYKKPHNGKSCRAPFNNGECGTCRDCWNRDIPNVSYRKH